MKTIPIELYPDNPNTTQVKTVQYLIQDLQSKGIQYEPKQVNILERDPGTVMGSKESVSTMIDY